MLEKNAAFSILPFAQLAVPALFGLTKICYHFVSALSKPILFISVTVALMLLLWYIVYEKLDFIGVNHTKLIGVTLWTKSNYL